MQDPIDKPQLAVVVPCYNEEDVLPLTLTELTQTLGDLVQKGRIAENSYILCVDDGSLDRTWSIIDTWARKTDQATGGVRVYGLKLAKNAGHQAALLAGYHSVADRAHAAISIDADLQDDVSAISAMVEKYRNGYDVVYGVRNDRTNDTWFKRSSAHAFYRLMRWMGVEIVFDHADYRLLSRRVLQVLREYREVNLFLRGIVPLLGFRATKVTYERKARKAGESKYPLKKMLAFAIEGITSFSVRPMRLVTLSGFGIFLVSVVALVYTLISKWFGYTEAGWTSIMLSIWFIGGLQLLGIGLLGEYIGKIYLEVKDRPRYVIETALLPEVQGVKEKEQDIFSAIQETSFQETSFRETSFQKRT